MKRVSKISKVFSFVVVILVLLAAIGGTYYLTRGYTADLKSFYLKIDDRVILRDEAHISIQNGDVISVKSLKDYTVSVYACADYNDFDLVVDGAQRKWSDYVATDFLTGDYGISVDKQKDRFTLNYGGFAELLSPTGKVEFDDSVFGFDMFNLVVKSGNSTIIVSVDLYGVMPQEVKLSQSTIVFGRYY